MGFSFATGTLNIGTGALTTNYSVTGKTPTDGTWKAVILFWSGRPETTDAAGATDIQPGIGVATSATQRWAVTNQSDHGPTTTATDRCFQTTACVVALSITGVITPTGTSVAGFADFVSFNSDGFTLTIDDVFPAAIEVGYVLLGGTDLTNAQAGSYAGTSTTGNFNALTALSFVPDFLLTASIEASASAGSFGQGMFTVGAAISAANQFTLAYRSNDALGTSITVSYINTTDILAMADGTVGGVDFRDRFVDFAPTTGNGFRLNHIEGANNLLLKGYLCLKGGTYQIGNFLSATNTTAFTEAHGMSVTPKGAMFLSANRAESTVDVSTSHRQMSIGASDGTNNYCLYSADKHNSALADCFTGVSHDQCYFNCLTSATPMTMNGEGHVNSFDSTNINFQMTDADPSQAFVTYIAFGNTPGGGAFQPAWARGANVLIGSGGTL